MLIEVIDDPVGARACLVEGGVLERNFVRMELDLTRPLPTAPMPVGFTVGPLRADRIAAYARVVCAAYVAGHPDHQPEDDDPAAAAELLAGYLRGGSPGPWVAQASRQALGPDGGTAALIVVSEYDPAAVVPAQPWITELAVDPWWAGRGVGPALVIDAAARLVERGDGVVGLAVTVGNPARLLYERLGFATTHEVWRIRTVAV